MHRKVAAALVAALALGVASCGGSEETLTRAQVVRRIETACRTAQERTEKATRQARGENFLAAILLGQRQLTRDVEELEGSDDVADALDSLKSSLADRTEVIASVSEEPRAQQGRAFQAAEERLNSATRAAEAVYRRLGIRGCS